MTKKDYELIARIIKECGLSQNDLERIALDFAYTLASKNPRFNKDKFLKACGIEVEQKKCKCGLNPNYMQSKEQQQDEQDHINETGICWACENE